MGVEVSLNGCCTNDVRRAYIAKAALNTPSVMTTDADPSNNVALSDSSSNSLKSNINDDCPGNMDTITKDMLNDIDKLKIIDTFKKRVLQSKYLDAMYLIERYTEIDLMNIIFDDGNSVLHTSVDKKNSKFTIFLLQNGVDINVQNIKTGNTPLHLSVINDDVRMTAILLKKKARINIKNMYGKTVLDIAKLNNYDDIIDLLTNQNIMEYYANRNKTESIFQYGFNINDEYKDIYLNEMKYSSSNDVELDAQNSGHHSIFSISNITDVSDVVTSPKNDDQQNQFNYNTNNNTNTHKRSNALDIIKEHHASSRESRQRMNAVQKRPSERELLKVQSLVYINDISTKKLDIYQGWIYKRKVPGKFWKKRWLCIKDGYMLWNDKRITMNTDIIIDKTQKLKWKGYTSLLFVKDNGVHIMDTKHGDSILCVNVLSTDMCPKSCKKYQFKCFKNQQNSLDYWLNALISHINALNGEYQW